MTFSFLLWQFPADLSCSDVRGWLGIRRTTAAHGTKTELGDAFLNNRTIMKKGL